MNYKNRNAMIDAIKGICIILIVITHYSFTKAQRMSLLFPLFIEQAVPMLMVIMGYNYANSYMHHNIFRLADAYNFQNVARRILRILIPYLFFSITEVLLDLFHYNNYGFGFLIENILPVGGFGAGNYFVPVVIQTVFIYPLVYFLIKRDRLSGLIFILIVNIIYEYCCVLYGMGEPCYRLLCFRYLFCLAIGSYSAILGFTKKEVKESRNRKWGGIYGAWAICVILGGSMLVGCHQGLIHFKYINSVWILTSYISGIYLLPFSFWILIKVNREFTRIIRHLEDIGRASFNIYLVQMIYYVHISNYIYAANYWGKCWGSDLAIGLVICLFAGIVFHAIESKFTSRLITEMNKNIYDYTSRLKKFINSLERFV